MANILHINRSTGAISLPQLDVSSLLSLDGSGVVSSVGDLTAWVAGTANQISVADDGDGTITLSTPQDIATTSSVEFGAVLVDQDSNSVGLEVDSEATTLTNYGLSVTTGHGAIAACITYGTANEGQFLAGLPNNSAYVGNFAFYRNLTADSTDNAVVYIHQDHASDNQACLELQQDGSGYALIANGNVSVTGSINVTDGVTISSNIVIPDNGYIGSVSDTDAIQIDGTGNVTFSQIIYAESDISCKGNLIFTVDNAGVGYSDNSPMLVFNDGDNQVEVTGNVTISELAAASRLLACDGSKKVVSTDLASWVDGTANQIAVADDGDGSITLSFPADVSITTSLTVPSIKGGSGSGDDITLESSSHETKGHVFIQPNVGKVNIGSTSTTLKGSYSLALVGPDGNTSGYPSIALYTDADDYPLITHLPYKHDNVQQLWNCYWNGTQMEICHPGGVYRWASRENLPAQDTYKLQWYDASSADAGDTFADATWKSAITIDNQTQQVIINSDELATVDFRVAGDSSSNLIFCDASADRVGIGTATPACLLDVVGAVRLGDSSTNYTAVSATGDVTFAGTAGFYPVRLAQSAQPTPGAGEIVIWRDTDDGKVYLVYNDADSGVKSVEMT